MKPISRNQTDNQLQAKLIHGSRELLQGEAKYRRLVEISPDAMVIVDRQGVVRFVNSAAEALFGRKSEEMVGQLFGLPVANGKSTEVEIVRSDQQGATAQMLVAETEWEGQAASLASLRDITEQKRSTVRRLDELSVKTLELEQANNVRSEFLSLMSHELRTPLNVIIGYTEMIRDGAFGQIHQEQKEALTKIRKQTRVLLDIITGVLQATQIESGAVTVYWAESNAGRFLDGLKASYENPSSKELTLKWDYSYDLPLLRTDAEKLGHILKHLINNAIKFTEKGNVSISARHLPESKRVEFKVADTGIGISKQSVPVIFDIFRQVDSSETRPFEGAGLGLYLVRKYSELLGGTVEVESELGKGSTFTVAIPCVR